MTEAESLARFHGAEFYLKRDGWHHNRNAGARDWEGPFPTIAAAVADFKRLEQIP